ncbi:MAG TPA: prolipoprotein diacylglyceryl transferase family protein [Parasegetibacter sp.]
MYPNLYYAFQDLFGVEIRFLRFVNSFGFFVALAFIAAAVVLTRELKRKEREGLLQPMEETITVGKPAGFSELLINFIIGFLFGYKIAGAYFLDASITDDTQAYIFSAEGHMPSGIILGLVFAGLRWWDKRKQMLPKPEQKKVRVWPHDRVGDMVIFAAIFGFAGAKVFHNLENWNEFVADPIGSLFSPSGLTFYGGLICAAVAIWYYAKKKGIHFWHLNDAAAPALMLAYALGRVGCQVSGDGDWGIVNNNPKPFSWIPDWAWAYNYPHNVNNEGVPIPGCVGQYCSQLPEAVYPTPLYETLMCLILFGMLMAMRKRIRIPGVLFSIYLIFNGMERFLIEKIRVNTTYSIMGFEPTQAELISGALVISGIVLWYWRRKLSSPEPGIRKPDRSAD